MKANTAQRRQNGCILTLVVFLLIVAAIVMATKLFKEKREAQKAPKNAIDMAFKPELPEYVLTDVIAGKNQVIYRGIKDPEKGAKLVSKKYAKTIKKVAAEMVKAEKIPASAKPGLIETLEGIVMIESGGDILAKSSKKAAGIAQMIPATARQFGKLKVDETKGEKIRQKIIKGRTDLYAKLCRVDERYDPYKCIRGGARYLAHLYGLYGQWDFCILAYHSGAGTANNLIDVYMKGNYEDIGHNDENIRRYGLSYEKIYFDCSPKKNPGTYSMISGWQNKDDDYNATYYWNVLAAQKAVQLFQKNRQAFRKNIQVWKNLTVSRRRELVPEVVWYPLGTKTYQDAGELGQAYERGELVKAPDNPVVFGYRLDTENIGTNADESVRDRFYGSTPEIIGLVMTIGYLTRQESGNWDESLTVTSLVRSRAYQARLGSTSHSVHTLGRAVDFSRLKYQSDAQRAGFQYALDYLRACGDICYAKEGNYAIHVALNPAAVSKYRQIYQDGIDFLRHSK